MTTQTKLRAHDPAGYEFREHAATQEAQDWAATLTPPTDLHQVRDQFQEVMKKLAEHEAQFDSLLKATGGHGREVEVWERLWQMTWALKRAEWMAWDLTQYLAIAGSRR
jgi:hypothetical protein